MAQERLRPTPRPILPPLPRLARHRRGLPPTDEGPGDEVDAFLVEHLYDRSSPILKFNLFAYARSNTGAEWDGPAATLTGCTELRDFRKRCKAHRFPLYRRLVAAYGHERHSVRVVLCTGLSWSRRFLDAFTPEGVSKNPMSAKAIRALREAHGFRHRLEVHQTGPVEIVVAPFYRLSYRGQLSDIDRLADIARDLLQAA